MTETITDRLVESRRLGHGRTSRVTKWVGPTWLWVLLILIVVGASLTSEFFFTSRNLSNVMRQSIPLGIVAIGQTLVVLIGGIDIAVAATIAMANTALMGIVAGQSENLPLGIGVALLCGLLVGVVNGRIIVGLRVPPFIVTLATTSMVTGITFLYTDQTSFGKPSPEMTELGFATIGPFPVLFFVFAVIAVIALLVQNRTAFGRYLYAVGGSEETARISGIPVRTVKLAAYTLCGLLAAAAGVTMSMRMGTGEPLSGVGYDWDSVAAVVVGGTALTGGRGGVAGTILGVAVISLLNNVMNLLAVSTFTQTVIKGVIVVFAVLLSALSARIAQRGGRASWRTRNEAIEVEA